MEKIYSENLNKCRLAKTSLGTIQFLLNYSKSLQVINYRTIQFENNLN